MKYRSHPWKSLTVAALLVSVAFVAACGSDVQPTSDPPTPTATTESTAPVSEMQPMELPTSFESATFDGFGDTTGFSGTTFAHGNFDTNELAGKPIVINFWFPSCPPCRAELEHFESVYQRLGTPAGGDVQFIGIQQLGLDSIEDGAALFQELGVTFPGLPDNDSSIQIAYNVFSYPTTVFLDRNHNEHRVWQGAIDEENLIKIVEEVAATSTSIDDDEIVPEEGESVDVALDKSATASEDQIPELVYANTEVFTGFGDAPAFKGDTFHHGTFDLSKHEGKPVVINFWFPSCPPCRAEIPNFEHAYQTLGPPGSDQIVFIGIQAVGFDTAADGVEFLDKMKANYPSIPDVGGAIHIAYQIVAAPTTIFLDKDHNVLSVHQGYIRHNQLQDILDELT